MAFQQKPQSPLFHKIQLKAEKVNTGDVVITNTSENLDDVGKARFILVKSKLSPAAMRQYLSPEGIIGKYFAYFTQTNSFYNEKESTQKGQK